MVSKLPRLKKCKTAFVLGSGLGGFADELKNVEAVPYLEIPHLPAPSVKGHAGQLVVGQLGRGLVAVLQGRVHLYEGHSAADTVRAVRGLARAGVRHIVLTNAAGAIRGGLHVGDLVLLTDHLNLSGHNPLVGPASPALGGRFPDCSDLYQRQLRAEIRSACERQRIAIKEGVYAAMLGGSYETPAEIRMLATMGADLVGMSTANEALAAHNMGARVVAMSFVTNIAAGLAEGALSHGEVTEAANAVQEKLARALRITASVLQRHGRKR